MSAADKAAIFQAVFFLSVVPSIAADKSTGFSYNVPSPSL